MTTLIDQFVEPIAAALTPEVARKIVELRADPQLQAEIDDLAEKANFGLLTQDEKAKYERYLTTFHVVSILQARARQLLRCA